MTAELQAALVDATQRYVTKMKAEDHSNLQDLRDKQRQGQITNEEFVHSRNAKVGHINKIREERRALLEQALMDGKHRQMQRQLQGAGNQQMDAILAALNDVSQRLAKLERDRDTI